MRFEVDWDRCEGHGRCEQTAPEVFQLDGNGDLHLRIDVSTEPVPPHLEPAVRAAVNACPMAALKLLL